MVNANAAIVMTMTMTITITTSDANTPNETTKKYTHHCDNLAVQNIPMGINISKTEVTKLTEVLTNVTMTTIQSCAVQVDQSQYVNAANSGFQFGSSTDIRQSTKIDSKCFSNVQKQTELQNNIIEAISNASTAKGVGILGLLSASISEAKTNVTNMVKNTVTMTNIQKSYTALLLSQGVTISNSGVQLFTTNKVVQGAEVFAEATMQELAKSGIFSQIQSKIDQTSSATTDNPLTALAELFGSFGMAIFAVIAAVIFIFVAMGYMGSSSSKGDDD